MPNPTKWDIWIGAVWILAAGAAIYSTFLIMRSGIIGYLLNLNKVSIEFSGYDYLVISALLGLTMGLFLFAVLCSMINDDLKSLIFFLRDKGLDMADMGSSGLTTHHLASDEFADDRKALKVLRMSRGSPLRGLVSEKAIIYHINDTAVSTAAEANAALVKGSNTVQWKESKGAAIKTSEVTVLEQDLKAQFEQQFRS